MFKIGDRVVCVDGDELGKLVKGKEYVVRQIDGVRFVFLEGVPGDWYAYRFKLVSKLNKWGRKIPQWM